MYGEGREKAGFTASDSNRAPDVSHLNPDGIDKKTATFKRLLGAVLIYYLLNHLYGTFPCGSRRLKIMVKNVFNLKPKIK